MSLILQETSVPEIPNKQSVRILLITLLLIRTKIALKYHDDDNYCIPQGTEGINTQYFLI